MPSPSDLEWLPVAFAGGLQDSKALSEPTDFLLLEEFAVYRGRLAVRAPLVETCALVDDQVTPADIDQVLAAGYHNGKLYVVGYSAGQTDVYLYRLETDGAAESGDAQFPNASPIATVWASTTTIPKVTLTSFEGGSATAGKQRLYIADYTGVYKSRYWNSTDGTAHDVTEDFDDDGTKEDLFFPLIFEYSAHLFGTRFYQSGTTRKGLLRVSQAGLIPADEPGVTNNPSREWWFSDFRQVGSRGEQITAVGEAGGAKMLFKRRQAFALFGFDLQSFQLRHLSGAPGAVGPHAVADLPDGRCVAWGDRGPYLFDGQRGVDIGEDIRKRVNEVTFSEDTTLGFSVDDHTLYCIVPTAAGSPGLRLAWDVLRERWVGEGRWKATGGANLAINAAATVPDDALPGPAAAPSGVTATVTSDTVLTLDWTNGDTAIDTVTDIHRSTSSGFTPGPSNLVTTVVSGVETHPDTGRTAETTYYYKLIHRRNAQSSAASVEASGKTAVAAPTAFTASSLPTGVRVKLTNNSASADIVIERKPPGGAFSVLTTLTSVASGPVTHDDTTATCGVEYTYRAKATKATFTDSPYTIEASFEACNTAPTLTTARHTATIAADCPTGTNVTLEWAGTNLKPIDTVLIERNDNGAGYATLKTVPAQDLAAADTWGRRSGATSHTLRYRLTIYDGGTVPGTPVETTQSSHSVNTAVCPES